jgi:hypothetical protein
MTREIEMRALFEEWRTSGKPRATFAREHDVSINTFHYWCQRFEGKSKRTRGTEEPPAPPPAFVEINKQASSSATRQPRIRFELPDGTAIFVY